MSSSSDRGAAAASLALAILAAGVAAAIYLFAGTLSAFLIADDFQWLFGADTFSWSTLTPGSRNHFFRPTTSLWFAGAATVCGTSAPCFHGLNVGVHALNVALLFGLVRLLGHPRLIAFAAAVTFGVMPAFVPAVMWVSAVTGLLAACGVTLALCLQVASWRRPQLARFFDVAAVVVFAVAVFAHEGAAMLPALSWLVHRMAPAGRRWRTLGIGFAIVLAGFAWAAVTANRDNYVFRDGHYAPGVHMLQSALDYVVSIWVGPHVLWAYILSIPLLIALAVSHRLARFGVLWVLITLIPFVGFTWGNVGRYSYLPSMGFAVALAGALAAALTRVSSRGARVAMVLLAVVVVMRFATFTYKGARGDLTNFEPTRVYLQELQNRGVRPVNGVVEVPRPASPLVDPQYLEPMLRWLYRDPSLQVIVR